MNSEHNQDILCTKCPDCGGVKLIKRGKTSAGLLKFRCSNVNCRRQFVAGSSYRIDKKIKAIIEGLLREKISPTIIARALEGEVSVRWLYNLRKRLQH